MKTNLDLSRLAPSLIASAFLLLVPVASAAPLPNAWQITDNNQAALTASYSMNLSAPLQSAALSNGWRFTIHARFVNDFDDTTTMVALYGVGNDRFSIFWDLDGNNDLTVTPFGQPTVTLTTNGTGAALYHTYEIVYNATSHLATFYFDGIARATWDGDGVVTANGHLVWGSGSSAGRGQINFHKVTFTVGTNVITYDAGTQNNPPVAPNPQSQGWTAAGAAAGTTNAISPDGVSLPTALVATTLAATGVEPHEATLRGVVDLGGLAALGWIEWGATTNYGNNSTPQFLKAGQSAVTLSHTIASLPAGATYHYRCVATNVSGAAYGLDTTVTTPPTWLVTTLANSGAGSLRQQISDALAGDTISFGVTGAVVLSSGQLSLAKDLNIVGPGPQLLAVDGNEASRVFVIASGVNVTISGLTIRDGKAANGGTGGAGADGGGIHNSGNLTLSNCGVMRNVAGHGGDGADGTGNDVGGPGGGGGDGGGIYSPSGSSLTLLSCSVTGNTAGYGGYGGSGADGVLSGANGEDGGDGGSGGRGGGIFSSGLLNCVASTITGNDSGHGGSGGYGGDAILGADGGDGGNGGDGGDGGGIYGANVTLTETRVSGNLAYYGGYLGIGGSGSPSGYSGSLGMDGRGGGLYCTVSAVINTCTCQGNYSYGNGGGIYISGAMVIKHSTFTGNNSDSSGAGYGGGVYSSGSLQIENSTFNNNQAPAGGGGILHSGTLTINNCTFATNFAGAGSGIHGFSFGLTNTIVADTIFGNFNGTSNLIGGNPRLNPLGNYGGPTQTMPPRPDSPAIDAGRDSVTNFLATDQRGYRRRSGASVDIGAVEVQAGNSNNPPVMTSQMFLVNGAMRLTFTNDPAITFSVYAATNLTPPSNQWTRLGAATEPSAGQYQYTDSTATNHLRRFYKIAWP